MKPDEILTYNFIEEVVREEMDWVAWVAYHAEDEAVRHAASVILEYYTKL